MIQPAPCSFESFPESDIFAEGIRVIQADTRQRLCTVHFSVKYTVHGDLDLHLHIIEPSWESGEKAFPIVLFIQGSGWMKQHTGMSIAQLSRFASRGYVIAVVEYRPSTVAPFPAQILDTKEAMRFMHRHAGTYHGDPANMIVWGDSSGAHTAVMTGLADGSLQVKAIIDYYGPTDISKMNEEPSTIDHIAADSPEGLLLGGVDVLENMDRVAPTVPMNHISADRAIPPVLIVHGSRDRLVPFGQSVLLYEALKKADKDVLFYQLKGADHGGSAFWTDQVLDIVAEFIEEQL